MRRTIQITMELEKDSPDFLDKVTGRIYMMDEVKKTDMEAKYIDQGVIEAAQAVIDRLENELKDASVAAIAEAVHVDELLAKLKVLTVDAERYRWLAKEHGWRLLKHFHAVRPYVDASEVIDESIDAAMWRNA